MKFLSTLSLIPSLASAVAITSRAAPSGLKVTSVTYGGTGCPQGSLSVDVSSSGDVCPIVTSGLLARAGDNISVDENRKFCQINFGLSYPQGYSFTVLAVDYVGYVNLKAYSDASIKSTYYFSGDASQVSSEIDFTGPVVAGFDKTDALVWDTWSPCGKAVSYLNVKQEVTVHGDGRIASVVENGKFINSVVLGWKKC